MDPGTAAAGSAVAPEAGAALAGLFGGGAAAPAAMGTAGATGLTMGGGVGLAAPMGAMTGAMAAPAAIPGMAGAIGSGLSPSMAGANFAVPSAFGAGPSLMGSLRGAAGGLNSVQPAMRAMQHPQQQAPQPRPIFQGEPQPIAPQSMGPSGNNNFARMMLARRMGANGGNGLLG